MKRLTTPQSRLGKGARVRVNANHRGCRGKAGIVVGESEKISGTIYYSVRISDASHREIRFTARELDVRGETR